MPLSSSNTAAIACYAEATVSDAEIVPSPLRRRLEHDPWARTLGIEFLDVRRGHCRVRLQLRSHMEDGRAVASAHAVAHRLTA
jgi:acyl-coenzyme A thioesterase PaaI-like protein